ncbi:MAG: zinc ribbon domain-containing protein [Myxococcales bacterium]|nr:zinc ribbon domain-containing protein [Myxococcales bacterium]
MANERDIQWAIESVEKAITAGELAAAKAGLAELTRLAAVFDGVAAALDDGEGQSRAMGLADKAREALCSLSARVCEIEIDQREPGYAQRLQKRRERVRDDVVDKVNRAAQLLSLIGPRLAGFIELAKAGRPIGESDLTDLFGAACPRCEAKTAVGARFCLSCGEPLTATCCAACEAPLPPQARFCPACGASTEAGEEG